MKKLNRIFEDNAATLHERARNGLPFAVLVSDESWTQPPQSFASKGVADRVLDALNDKGIGGAVAEVLPEAKDPKYGYKLFVRPIKGYGTFDF